MARNRTPKSTVPTRSHCSNARPGCLSGAPLREGPPELAFPSSWEAVVFVVGEFTFDKGNVAGSRAASVFQVKLETSLKGTVSGGPFECVDALKMEVGTSVVVVLVTAATGGAEVAP